MKSLVDVKISIRLNLVLGLVIFVGIVSLGVYITSSQKSQIESSTSETVSQQVSDMAAAIKAIATDRGYIHSAAFRISVELVNKLEVSFNEDVHNEIQTINNVTGEAYLATIPQMLIDGRPILRDERFVDTIKFLTYQSLKLYQLTPKGFVCVSSNITDADGKRLIGDLYPPNHDISKAIIKKSYFVSEENINNEYHKTAYFPIYKDGEVEGMLCTATKHKNILLLFQQFCETTILENGYSLLIHKDGEYILGKGQFEWDLDVNEFDGTYTVNPQKMKGSAVGTEMFNIMSKSDSLVGKINLIEDGEEVTYFYEYSEIGDCYAVAVVYQKDIDKIINRTRTTLFIALAAIMVIIILVNNYISKTITKPLEKSVDFAKKISIGELGNELNIEQQDEVGVVARALSALDANLGKTALFAEDIGNGLFDTEFKLLSEKDTLGQSLLTMRDRLAEAKRMEDISRKESSAQRWMDEGFTKFGDIMRKHNTNIKDLTYQIISNLIKYMEMNQGAIFTKNEDDPNEVFYEAISTVAYDRNKVINTKIRVGDGLVGQCIFEKESIYLTNVPNDYLNITSGLGNTNPSEILIVPLIANEQVMGVIELAGFNKLDELKIKFVEKLAENIGATLLSVSVNEKTNRLLEQSKQQSEELAAQEEEMRQNLEELQATQEDASYREKEMQTELDAYNSMLFVTEYDQSGKILSINENYAHFLKVTKDELVDSHASMEFKKISSSHKSFEQILNELKTQSIIQHHITLSSGGNTLQEVYTLKQSPNDDSFNIIKIGLLKS